MSGALESSVTLDDVFVVVGAKRVPLAPELAGYLTLEIAEGSAQALGDVDPRSVYIGEEGTVALVNRPRRDPPTGDTESSIRAVLARLLEASGSQTPGLGSVAGGGGRTPGMGSLIEELEAALIPVNRAAGRRALARLAREVKRVTPRRGGGKRFAFAPGEPGTSARAPLGGRPRHSTPASERAARAKGGAVRRRRWTSLGGESRASATSRGRLARTPWPTPPSASFPRGSTRARTRW